MKRLFYILALILVISCEKQIDWPVNETITPKLVVEGLITNNPKLNYVRLSLPVSDAAQIPQALSGAAISVLSLNGSVQLNESTGEAGYYTTDTDITGVIGEGYRLYISIGEYEFTSQAVGMLPVSQLKDLSYYELNSHPGYFEINPTESSEPSFIEYRCRYENPLVPGDTIQNQFYSFTLHTIDVNQFFKPDQERLFFPEGTMVVRTKYSLAPDHERFIRSILSETEWRGGWFDILPGNPHTNMSQGAVGYFGACSALRDTIYLQ